MIYLYTTNISVVYRLNIKMFNDGLQNKKDIAYRHIKKIILEEPSYSNRVLSINYFAMKLGMSRSPIRDAIHKLQAEGFLKIVDNRGIFVQELTISEATQIYELRMAVESYLLRKIANMISKNDIKNLRKILEEQQVCIKNKNISSFLKLDNDFHLYFHKIYFNKMFYEIISNIKERIFYIGLKAFKASNRMEEALKDHTGIVDALEQGDIKEANNNLENNLQRGLSSATIVDGSKNINFSKKD